MYWKLSVYPKGEETRKKLLENYEGGLGGLTRAVLRLLREWKRTSEAGLDVVFTLELDKLASNEFLLQSEYVEGPQLVVRNKYDNRNLTKIGSNENY